MWRVRKRSQVDSQFWYSSKWLKSNILLKPTEEQRKNVGTEEDKVS
jgi:hypothetical protein